MSEKQRPVRLTLEDTPKIYAPLSETTVSPLVNKERFGTTFNFGVAWFEPGEATKPWRNIERSEVEDQWRGPTDEVFFGIRGRVRVTWDEGVLEFGPEETLYLAPGWTYSIENAGAEPASFAYCLAPPSEYGLGPHQQG